LIKTDLESLSDNTNIELIKGKINHISTKLNDHNQAFENQINKIAENISFEQDFDSVKNSIENSVQSLHSNIDNLRENFESSKVSPELENIKTSLNFISEKLQNNSSFYETSSEDLVFLKENFYKINEKFSEITHLIRTNTSESEELNNRFEVNITQFNSGFQNLYEQFNGLDNTFKSSFADFRICIQDIYDQFSTIDNRSDIDQVKFYVQSFNNKIISIAEILESLKENNFSIKVDNAQELEEFQKTQDKIEYLNNNICTFLDKIDNNYSIENAKHSKVTEKLDSVLNETKNFSDRLSDEISSFATPYGNLLNEKSEEINNKLNSVLDETKNFSNRISDEFSSFASPLSSAIELTSDLKDSLEELLALDSMKVQQEAGQLLDKFENIYKNSENNLEVLFNSSKHFYEKLEELKTEFSNISYDTNSKISDFVSKADHIELKIQNNLSSAENALDSLKNISRFAENQINLTSESLNLLKTGVSHISEDFGCLKNDITDISSKVNKIILNEKENSASFTSSFNDLKEELDKNFKINTENSNQIGEKIIKKLSDEIKDFSKKFDKIESNSSKTLETSEDVKSALVCMAEWFDSAGKLIEENNSNIKKHSVEIDKTDSLVKRTEENVSEQIKRISDKLNRFEIRMESIEGKIEKLQDQNGNREVLNVLSDILEKVELSNERSKSNEIILNRLENLEFKLEEIENAKTAKTRKKLSDCST